VGAAFLACGLPAAGATIDVRGAAGKSGVEVCVFQAGDPQRLISRLFNDSRLICSPAGHVHLGPGNWNAFARARTELISRGVTTVDESQSRQLPVTSAGVVHFSGWPLARDESYAVFIPSTQSGFPVRDGSAVPADVELIPLSIARGTITAVGAPFHVAAGKTAIVERTRATAGRIDVVVPVVFTSFSPAPATMELTDGAGSKHREVIPSVTPASGGSTLVFIRGVAAGKLVMKVDDASGWSSGEQTIDALAGNIAVAEPMRVASTTKLALQWRIDGPTSSDMHDDDGCKAGPSAIAWSGRSTFIDVSSCSVGVGSNCPLIARFPIDGAAREGILNVDRMPLGPGIVSFARPNMPGVMRNIEVRNPNGATATVLVSDATISGTLTRGGRPVWARVFRTTTERTTGRFVSVVDSVSSTLKSSGRTVGVAFCDGSPATTLFLNPPQNGGSFDIELPDTRLNVMVADADSGRGVPKATVRISATHGRTPELRFGVSSATTDDGGAVAFQSLPLLETRVCATAHGYVETCTTVPALHDGETRSLTVAIGAGREREGRFLAATPIRLGHVVWISSDGRKTEDVEVQEDGTFHFVQEHSADETVVAISLSTPLLAFRYGSRGDARFEIALPNAPVRSFDVTLAADSRESMASIAMAIGDVVVPESLVTMHGGSHGGFTALARGATTRIRDVYETGPITVILVPHSLLPQSKAQGFEAPLGPNSALFPRENLGERGGVTFR
jgi:hypothetical protein